MQNKRQIHQFLVPAYGDSPYLKDCLSSLRNQKIQSPILISTSTPFDGISSLAKEYDADIFVHGPNKGIANDWNVGLQHVTAEWVTIAHQDDIYLPNYTIDVLESLKAHKDAVIAFTNYAEILSDGTVRRETTLLKIKQALLFLGFLGRNSIADRWSKTNLLRFGSPIPCPSVTLKNRTSGSAFETGFRLNMDWAAWLRMAHEPGSFVWVKRELMHHRIHEDSETSDGIKVGYRSIEDFDILCRIWPKPIARMITKTYSIAYRNNSH